MLNDRKAAFDVISRVFAIMRLDIEHHQAINDLSLNIHGENYFRDIFNFIYDRNFVNANLGDFNAPFIDLIEHSSKEIVQITTTRTKDKILHTLNACKNRQYAGYKISIYYLLDKAMPNAETTNQIENGYNINLKDTLKDYRDIIRDIEALESKKLIDLCDKYFKKNQVKYTDKIVLDLVYKKLLKEKSTKPLPSHDDDWGTIETDDKFKVNSIRQSISSEINKSLEYTTLVSFIDDGALAEELKEFVVDELYRDILIQSLRAKVPMGDLVKLKVADLHLLSKKFDINFNKVINSLHHQLESKMIISDFNSMAVSWILIAHFFEVCDVGMKK
ncbi:SMEK domain-containing protein [Pseudoalteromonas sp. SG43-6]|uniref:SMEK domain-containing protein n=1 Tax=Pseudoalteromonas sp. SG43-6 TaxID=2760967 RepID=UPI0016023FA1|nr:SMEK domain-containing protein [Pseudoalteromonas sp. SG43-6]MBB1434668.1 SMEK domain-containing protein [Pseudoalteromonas sp. SG43-6]